MVLLGLLVRCLLYAAGVWFCRLTGDLGCGSVHSCVGTMVLLGVWLVWFLGVLGFCWWFCGVGIIYVWQLGFGVWDVISAWGIVVWGIWCGFWVFWVLCVFGGGVLWLFMVRAAGGWFCDLGFVV